MVFNKKLNEDIEDLKAEAKAYVDSTIEYYQLWGFKVATKLSSFIIKIFALSLLFVIALILLSVALAMVIGSALESTWLGFLIVAVVYILLGFLIIYFRKNILDSFLIKRFSDIFFNS